MTKYHFPKGTVDFDGDYVRYKGRWIDVLNDGTRADIETDVISKGGFIDVLHQRAKTVYHINIENELGDGFRIPFTARYEKEARKLVVAINRAAAEAE